MKRKNEKRNIELLFSDILEDISTDQTDLSRSNSQNSALRIFTPAQRILREQVLQIICDFSAREQKILKMRFGLDDGVMHTFEEVGEELGVTSERVRQIEKKLIPKLQKSLKEISEEYYKIE